jgi:hypothetical protein
MGRKLLFGVLQTFLDLLNLIGSEVPVVHFAGGRHCLDRAQRGPAVRSVPDLDAAVFAENIEQAARSYEKSFEVVSNIIAQQSQIPRQ